MTYLFVPPTYRRRMTTGHPLLDRFSTVQGQTVLDSGLGVFTTVEDPSGEECAAAANVYRAGHEYEVTDVKAGELSVAGYGACLTKLAPGAGTWGCGDATAGIVYTPAFSTSTNTADLSGSIRYSTLTTATIDFSFRGTGIRYVARKQSNAGIVQILLDGVDQGQFDLRAATTKNNQLIFESLYLNYGNHAIQIKNTGLTSGTNFLMDLDAFIVL